MSAAKGRVFEVTYEIVKDSSDTFAGEASSMGDLEELETDSNNPSPNPSNSENRKKRIRFENRLWENLSFSSNLSIQVLQSDQPFRNCLKRCSLYMRSHLKLVLFVLLAILILALIILALDLSLRDRTDFSKDDYADDSLLKALNLSDNGDSTQVCRHQLCKVKSNSMLSSLNKLVNPCDNFSRFACENYNAYLPGNPTDPLLFFNDDWTPLTRLAKWATVQLKRMLEDTNDIKKLNVSSISKAAEFYDICRRNFNLESTTNRDLKENFKEFFTALVDWPLIEDPPPDNNLTTKWSLEKAISGLILNGVNPFVKIGIVYHKPLEKNIIALDVGDLTYRGTNKYMKDMYKYNRNHYFRQVESAALMLGKQGVNSDWVDDLWRLEKHLFEITYNFSYDFPIQNNKGVFSMEELQNIFGNHFDLNVLFALVFSRNFNSSETIFLKNIYYFKNLPTVLNSTSEKSRANMAGWLFLMKISEFLPAEFSNYLSHVPNDVHRATENCLRATMDVFPSTTGSLYALKKALSKQDVDQIEGIFLNLIDALVALLEGQAEMKNKQNMVARVRRLRLEIVKKKNDVINSPLNKHYQSVVLMASAIENYLILKSKLSPVMFSALDKENFNVKKISPLDSSVTLHERLHKVQVPLALLQSPLYQSIYPRFLVYSSLGSIISHHIAHSLEELDGLSIKECLENQHNQRGAFNIENLGERFVVSELIADNIGLRTAYNAYKKWQSTEDAEERFLPENKFNKEQLFFINYAQTWCRNKQPDEWMDLGRNYDYHQPSRHRVNNVLRNMPEFSKAFYCPSLAENENICVIT